MANNVMTKGYKVRKWVEDTMYRYARWTGVIPLYTMVSFGGMPYSEIKRKRKRQGRMLQVSAWIGIVTTLLVASIGGRKLLNKR